MYADEEYSMRLSEVAAQTNTPEEEVKLLAYVLNMVIGIDLENGSELLVHPRLARRIAEQKSRGTYCEFLKSKTPLVERTGK
jgi:hypothetical protein